jgi:hypothetical protein
LLAYIPDLQHIQGPTFSIPKSVRRPASVPSTDSWLEFDGFMRVAEDAMVWAASSAAFVSSDIAKGMSKFLAIQYCYDKN